MDLKSRKHSFGQNAFHFVWKIKYAKDLFKFYGLKMDCEFFLRQVDYRRKVKIYELHEAINAAAIRVATIMREHIPVGKKCSIVSADIIGTEQ